ncbi:MAG: hypothetical protein ACYDCK_12545 [Thermoplasmatota archaeon]
MAYRVFEVTTKDRARIDETLADDIVGRQSIVVRDASHFGMGDGAVFVMVEGEEKALLRAETLFLEYAKRAAAAEEIHRRIKAEEDDAASGLGFIMG